MQQKLSDQIKSAERLQLMDALLYLVAASAMFIISIAFLLWLRF